jgi:hypothetical protein
MTEVKSLRYDFDQQAGDLYMAECCCCDMSACIQIFERIDPKVRRIQTWAGGARDTIYTRHKPSQHNRPDNERDDWRAALPW